MTKKIVCFSILSLVICAHSFAGPKEGPCQQIKQACLNAGFIQGEVKEGKGLWRDCVDPIMQGISKADNSVLPLPVVDPSLVAACQKNHPKFGSGKAGI